MTDPENIQFTFADMFAGIGGMRYAFEKVNGKCVFTSEKDEYALKTYSRNFDIADHVVNKDILEIGSSDEWTYDKVPDFDVLVAGFPCQPYSIAGLRQGLTDVRGGDIFVKLIEVLYNKKPKAFLLENVAGLDRHNGGVTYEYMEQQLTDAGYWVFKNLMNTKDYTHVPQNRPRLFIIGLSKTLYPQKPEVKDMSELHNFEKQEPEKPRMALEFDEIELWPGKHQYTDSIQAYLENEVDEKYYYTDPEGNPVFECSKELQEQMKLRDTLYQWRRKYVRENKDKKCPTLTANMGSGGHNVPLLLDAAGRIRKLTPRECANFQGFGKERFEFPPNMPDSRCYHQIGNSVTVPLISKIAEKLIWVMRNGE